MKKNNAKILFFEFFFFLFLFTICVYLAKVDIPKYEEKKEDDVSLIHDGIEIEGSDILLNNYNNNLWIKKGGTYQISGTLKDRFLMIDTSENVTLIFDNITFDDEKGLSIINKQKNDLTLFLKENSNNRIKEIVSNGNVIIDGNGTLAIDTNQIIGNLTINNGVIIMKNGCNITGNLTMNQGFVRILSNLTVTDSILLYDGTLFIQEDSAEPLKWIIQGGKLIYFGMMENDQIESNQNVLSYTFQEKVEDDIFSIQKNQEEFLSIQVPSAFKSMIISTKELEEGVYTFYSGGNHLGNLENGIYNKGLYLGGTKLAELEYKSNKIENE